MKGTLSVLALSMLVLLPGCRPKGDPVTVSAPVGEPHGQGALVKKESVVVVPEFQKGKYKGIKISVIEVGSKRATSQVVPLGSDFVLPGTGLTIHVDTVLSAFGMGGGVITSRADTMSNPAAQVRISEGGKEIWKGWIFSLFPDAHPFAHAKYAIQLVDFVPAK